MLKYLKKDVVDLLKDGLDTNAYGRVEGLWNEQNFSSCYDFVDQCCNTISSHLSTVDKQRECPEECKEAASSLMFAAARFSDLPELRELRTIFTERFGNSMELYVNKEFVNKLKSTPPTRDVKLQMMQDIALESGLKWDSTTLEQKLNNNPLASGPESMKNGNDEKHKIDNEGAEYKIKNQIKYTSSESEVSTPIKDIQVDRIDRKVQQKETDAASTSEEENDDKEPFYYKSIRPRYTKERVRITKTTPDTSPTDIVAEVLEKTQKIYHNGDSDGLQPDGSIGDTKPKPKSVRRRIHKTWPGQDKVEDSKLVGSENVSSNGKEEGRQNLKISNGGKLDERDEEEKIMDRLPLHCSRKELTPETGESEDDLQPSPTEATRLRASSFQPEELNQNAHTHPKMPEYDDFLANLATLRGDTQK